MRLLIIDNYDSFTYNLVQYLREAAPEAELSVLRNDAFSLPDLEIYDAFILSPGPGIPSEAGLLLDVIRHYAKQKPILGICLGHQAIAEAFGGRLCQLQKVYHGLSDVIDLEPSKSPLFAGFPAQIEVGRYHSWVADKESFPDCLEVLASDKAGHIMALQHRDYPIFGLQFHPESVLTPKGRQLIAHFLVLINAIEPSILL